VEAYQAGLGSPYGLSNLLVSSRLDGSLIVVTVWLPLLA